MRAVYVIVPLALLSVASCTFKSREGEIPGGGSGGLGGDTPGGGGTGGRVFSDAGMPSSPCMGLRCQQTTCLVGNCTVPACPSGGLTTVTGTVFDPAGRTPLYNAIVYVPNAELAPLTEGASCDRCTAPSGSPIVKAITDSSGNFRLEDVPVGDNIPLVVQIGKWRRQTMIPNVAPCANTALTDPNLTRLPRNQNEGHIPKIALTTGGLDALECLLRKIGIEDSEFTPESGSGRINLFSGGTHLGMPINDVARNNSAGTNSYDATLNGGAMFTEAETWWESADNLKRYDIILHSCEGLSFNSTQANSVHANKSAAALQAMKDYVDAGGRMFASHWHNYWIERGPAPFPQVATFNHRDDPGGVFTATIDTSFPTGQALSEWLQVVGASMTMGQLPILGAKLTVQAVNAAMSQRWAYNTAARSVQYFSYVTPVGAAPDNVCGKVVFSDLHVSAGSGAMTDDDSDRSLPFPTGCRTTELSPQEKALLFMIFDLSACLGIDIG